ncbi:MAG TPA: WecB/TagA/CpsF family glycosyltransferase [Clostridia bacterium]|nr:WecB/TagA/CpsF family glycosyltransferase [Clostridia bacterium]
MKLQQVRILGKPVHLVDMEQAVSYLRSQTSAGHKEFVLAMNPEKIMKAREDDQLSRIIEKKATLLIADGVGVVLAGKVRGLPPIPRVTGVGLFEELTAAAAEDGSSIFLYGAAEHVVERAAEVLKERYPQLTIAGIQHGYEKDEELVVSRIQEARPDYLFVALGSPAQEKWISRNLKRLPVKLAMGVGGTFDVLAGNVKRAPEWAQKWGVEWLYRFVKQPSRAKRMLNLPKFMWLVLFTRGNN